MWQMSGVCQQTKDKGGGGWLYRLSRPSKLNVHFLLLSCIDGSNHFPHLVWMKAKKFRARKN